MIQSPLHPFTATRIHPITPPPAPKLLTSIDPITPLPLNYSQALAQSPLHPSGCWHHSRTLTQSPLCPFTTHKGQSNSSSTPCTIDWRVDHASNQPCPPLEKHDQLCFSPGPKWMDYRGSLEEMNFTYVSGLVVLRNVVKVFLVSSSSFARKTTGRNRSRSHLGALTRPKDEMGSQIVSSESDVSHPILVYLSQNNNSRAQARSFPALTAPEPEIPVIFGSKWDLLTNAWRQEGTRPGRLAELPTGVSPLQKRIFESGTFTIVLHATSSFT